VQVIPVFDPVELEKEMLHPTPGYLKPTTSTTIKEMPLTEEEIEHFKEYEQLISQKKKHTNRNDLNTKADLVEFLVKERTKKFEQFLYREVTGTNAETLGQKIDDIKAEYMNTLLFNQTSGKVKSAFPSFDPSLLENLGIIYEVLSKPQP
jgi:Glu-tRNA(Gln) amidotransferase subunit E-like FAD-binding protein